MLAPYKKADVSFRFIEEIGQEGQNSKVYLAHDEYLDCEIAIKEVVKSSLTSPDHYFSEAKLLYSSSHPNIVKINYAAIDNDNVYVSMPFYKSGSLSARMKKENLTSKEAIRYSIHFLSGLHHIHSKKLMHFDIKPNNIMLSDRDEALLSDFGLAETLDPQGFATPQKIYKLHTPPERYSVRAFNLTYDVYQAGLTMYRMVIGHAAFEEEALQAFNLGNVPQQIINGNFPQKKFQPHINKSLQKIILKCLEVDPANRYQSVLDILNDLSGISDGSLDWRQDLNNSKIWKKEHNDAIFELTLSDDSLSCSCFRTYSDGRARRKFGDMTVSELTPTKLARLFKNNG